jgi:aldose 1-epimerase
MEVYTTEPGVQFYAGNFLDGSNVGKGGKVYEYRSAICLEAQHFPDSPNQPRFPTVELEPGQEYRKTTIYKFSVK